MKLISYNIYDDKIKYLMTTDERLRKLITYIKDTKLIIETDGFCCLIKYIIGQQISDKARETIWNKFKLAFKSITPEDILKTDNNKIKEIGLSERKINCIKLLATEIINNNINFNNYLYYSNEWIIGELTKIKGIGRWTAEMYLIFSLGREDVLSKSDGTIKRTIKWLYNLDEMPNDKMIQKYFDKWIGYETIVSTFLWKSIELNLTQVEFGDIIKKME